MMGANCKTKKDLKSKIGTSHIFEETSLFGPEYKENGSFCVVGPSPYVRKWYAQVTVKDGIIVKVS